MTAPLDPKAWATVCAAAALRGLSLQRTDPADGPVRVFAVGSASRACLLCDAEVLSLLTTRVGDNRGAHDRRMQ